MAEPERPVATDHGDAVEHRVGSSSVADTGLTGVYSARPGWPRIRDRPFEGRCSSPFCGQPRNELSGTYRCRSAPPSPWRSRAWRRRRRGCRSGPPRTRPRRRPSRIAKTKMDLAKLAGLNAIRVTAQWRSGQTAPHPRILASLQNAVGAADLDGISVYLSIYPSGSSVTPLTPQARAQFTAFATSLARALPSVHRFIVGNEPNINRFWMPQFAADGSDVAAPAYEALLAQTYDALKAVVARVDGDRRRAVAARERLGRVEEALADDLRRRPRPRLPPERPHAPDHGRVLAPSLRGQLEHPAELHAPAHRRRSRSPTTRSSSRCSARRSTAPRRPARASRSSTTSSASSRRSRRRKRACTRAPSHRPRTRWPRPPRASTTPRRSRSPPASRPSRGSSSSTSATSRSSTAGSPASTTRTTRRSEPVGRRASNRVPARRRGRPVHDQRRPGLRGALGLPLSGSATLRR